jgi:hypothetical protein
MTPEPDLEQMVEQEMESLRAEVPRKNGRVLGHDQYQPSEDNGNRLPDIRINGRELRDISAEGIEAIVAANNPPLLFSRAGSVVRVDQAEEGRPLIVGVTDVRLRGEMTRSANFHKITKRADAMVRTSASPPLDAARDILSRPVSELGFPPIEWITEAPFIRPDGVIVSQPGYDALTRTFYAPVGNMKNFFVPDRPTADDIDGARSFVEEAICEFPFQGIDWMAKAQQLGLQGWELVSITPQANIAGQSYAGATSGIMFVFKRPKP